MIEAPSLRSNRASPPVPRRRMRALAACVLVAPLVGCGYWLGEEETILPGERISVRRATIVEATSNVVVDLPATRVVADWPQAGGEADRAVGHVAGEFALERAWSASVGAGSTSEARVTSPPVAANGRAYALDADSQVAAIGLASGDSIWEADLTPEDEDGRDGFGGGVAVAGDRVIATTGFGRVHALSAETGEELWVATAPAPIRAAPVVADGLAVVVTRDGQALAYALSDGAVRWRQDGVQGGAAMLGGAPPAISGQVVATPFASGEISIFRHADGRRGWTETLGAPRRGAALSIISDVSSAPVMQDGRIYAGGIAGRLVAFDIPSGRRVWGRDIGLYNPVWAVGDVLFLVNSESEVMALDSTNGATLWRTQLPRFADPEDSSEPFAYGGPVLAGGKLYITSSDSLLFEVDGRSGEILREVDLPGASSLPPIVAGGLLLVLDDDADLHAFR